MPLPIVYEEQAKDLIKNCTKSPFGRGEATIYDDNVRKSWQLEPDKFRITNPKWDHLIEKLVNDYIQKELGIGTEKTISFSLYKVLLYEQGGFFDFHRDTEKEDGMIATLVVQLPSHFSGGEVTVRQNEREKKFECNEDSTFSAYYVSFYCDCPHMVEPVTSGYRLALIYNLKYSGSDKISIIDNNSQVLNLEKIINYWLKAPMYSKLCYILQHKYSKAGLSPTFLKGKDEAAYQLLKQLCSVDLYFGILEKQESSCGNSEYDIDETRFEYKANIFLSRTKKQCVKLVEEEIFPGTLRRSMPMTSRDVSDSFDNHTWHVFIIRLNTLVMRVPLLKGHTEVLVICPAELKPLFYKVDNRYLEYGKEEVLMSDSTRTLFQS